jgi:hypothetical protein
MGLRGGVDPVTDDQLHAKFADVSTDPLPLPDRTCPCGRTFTKPFGMRVHQRTCPVANPTELERAAAERAGLPAAVATVKR